MRISLLLVMLGLLGTVLVPRVSVADEQSVRDAIAGYVQAFNDHDTEKLSRLWAEDAVHIDAERAESTTGRDQIMADLKSAFESSPQLQLSGEILELRLLRDDVACVSGTVTVSDGMVPPTRSRYSAILVSDGTNWTIQRMEEATALPPVEAESALAPLDWLAGSWKDQGDQTSVTSQISWSEGRQFLTRKTIMVEGDQVLGRSTEVIGWDPRSQEIRSWTFHSDGSFGQGVWSRRGNGWAIASEQTLVDGRMATGTYVLQPTDANSYTVRLIDRQIEGEPQPSMEPITVTRQTDQVTGESTEQEEE